MDRSVRGLYTYCVNGAVDRAGCKALSSPVSALIDLSDGENE